ncbi:MAG: NAD(P)-binding domain-containing protein [Acidobacteria bacterium]|nr:NAD(P)-binding domain-containing protein [Acidobacteriota bacterium]
MFSLFKRYFDWLQKDNPVGDVLHYPILKNTDESEIPNLYLIGDITGLPLLKFATKQGYDVINKITKEIKPFQEKPDESSNIYDVVIIGAGAAGLSAALEAKKQNLKYIVLEASRVANTIANFPSGKMIFAEPTSLTSPSKLPVTLATKEDTLNSWYKVLEDEKLLISEGMKVEDIKKNSNGIFEIFTENHPSLFASNVVLAIGQSANSRKLNIKGENLSKVSSKFYNPQDYKNQNILVIGGGDSAVESALALADTNKVTLSYRQEKFFRLKSANSIKINQHIKENKIKVIFNSQVKEIQNKTVILKLGKEEIKLPNDLVFKMIGAELPYEFLEKIGIKIENSWTLIRFFFYCLSVFIFTLVYFGKHLTGTSLLQQSGQLSELVAPSLTILISILLAFIGYLAVNKKISIKHLIAPSLLIITTLGISLFSLWYVSGKEHFLLLNKTADFWYSFLYSLTIVVFGIKRIINKNNSYITKQTFSLIFFQVFLLFLLPQYFLPWTLEHKLLPQWLEQNAFPNGSYWRVYGFILAYPLFIYNLFTNQPIMFWLVVSIVQTFIIIPILIYYFGKGAYCGWICSCGGLAETLGDSYRTLAPHGATAKKWENLSQIILFSIFLITFIWILGHWFSYGTITFFGISLEQISENLYKWYTLFIDIGFAGTIGLGTYFFYSGRIWCRYGCPLAALMNIYTKFSSYRIFADKDKCINCNICTKVCHMGIDVMGYAGQGRPMNDIQCVRCSACVVSCPMDVLSFGRTGKNHPHDPQTRLYQLKRK